MYTTPQYLKNDVFHVYGTHTYSRGGHTWTDQTHAKWQTSASGPTAVGAFLDAIAGEVLRDLGEQVAQSIRDAVEALQGEN